MKFIKLLFYCFGCLLITSNSFGCEYSLRSFYKIGMPFGGIDLKNPRLQNPPSRSSGPQVELLCIFTDSRIIVGLGMDQENKTYYRPNSDLTKFDNFESNYESYYLRLGYSLLREDGFSFEGGFRAGNGKFAFKEKGSENKIISDVYSLALDAKVVKTVITKSYRDRELKLNLIGGLGIQKAFAPSFQYNNREFSSGEFGVGVNIFFGIGFSF